MENKNINAINAQTEQTAQTAHTAQNSAPTEETMKLRQLLIAALILCAVALCSYSFGYRSAIYEAELVSVSEDGYELAFNGQIHSYS